MLALIALSPLAVVCTTLAFRKSATLAAVLGITSILILSIIFFPFNPDHALTTMQALAVPSLEVVFIILGGMLISQILEVRGAQSYITEHLISATGTPERATLLIAVGLAPFLESSIGYSLGVIITVPLLRKVGNSVTKSVALSLFGLTLTAWGSLGPGLIVTSELGGVTLQELGSALALFAIVPLLILNFGSLAVAIPRVKMKKYFIETLFAVSCMWGSLLVTTNYISVALGGVFASLAAIFAFLLIARLHGVRQKSLADRKLLVAATPYLILIGGVVLSSLLLPFFDSPIVTRIGTSPATWLVISGVASSFLMGLTSKTFFPLVKSSIKIGLKPGSVVILYLLFGGLLSATGMSTALAEGAVQFGLWNLLLIPGVNVIAGYITASISATGAMFSLSVAETASQLSLDAPSLLALQTLASAAAGILSPSRFAVATASLIADYSSKPPEKIQSGKIILTGFGLVGLIVPCLIGLTVLFGQF